MSKVNEISDRVLQTYINTGGDTEAVFDPAFIMVIAEIIVQLVEALQDCQENPEEAAGIANNPSGLAKIILRRKAITTFGRREFRRHGQKIMESILDVGRNLTSDEMSSLYSEV